MCEDSLSGGKDEVTELSRWEDVVGPFLEISDLNVVSGTDDSTFVDSTNKLDDDLFASVVIDNLELTNVVVFLHNFQEFEKDLGSGSQ
jgi:hypothetical protein